MKNSTPEAIDAEVEKAKRDVLELLASGRVFSYVLLCQIVDDADPLGRLVEGKAFQSFLKTLLFYSLKCITYNKIVLNKVVLVFFLFVFLFN